ncbi:hypothetical protein A3A76_01675 [Candidatus Woesebacteria bacterium RIFCSPLOWO2_01_FULL_39_23]|uniref:LcnD-like C-terminal domain-containing protein n=1 Tax=Candidatus Woesebacteria bacterium RIFCSPHIGHO2_01_FULL_40_22 TaxID=1802499 RepID=A0A1F7YEP4_9BACT|nr:MAG: hypothetical protein A2141_02250 [Candidatus Woesebacteria bacterium RBG_16_40_11]OGM25793.1 MAG: hypothetical protein A2628_00530 [Candidatus Woesebacteria bacterium RIFCSPHIGHO2_01_FULL_40_22]OGM36385.1 MAG: hypothetical protein A3E41_04850 [Candidatus Woesebacteria bacterium RIFCSPHIGHO2_12_FULL_38_9]OGM61745.1 MAG: hypothetical protein A3A76_01675 [Candidatus Woesebacteria bacterium RIFCSPLOWO2_01_FULL_39_23]
MIKLNYTEYGVFLCMEKKGKQNIIRKMLGSRKRLIILIILAILFATGWRYLSSRKTASNKTSTVEKGNVSEELVLSGTIEADEHANLAFLSSGQLDKVFVTEGQTVVKGQELARLDTTSVYQTLLEAEADLRRYDASLQKTYDDVQGHESDESFAQRETRTIAETNRDKAYRNYVIAQKNLSNSTLRAPFAGVVSSITHPFSGINTTLTESQIEIVNQSTVYFDVSADQTDVINLDIGKKMRVILDAFPDDMLEGEIKYISLTPQVGEVGTVYKVKVNFKKLPDSQKVRIGMSGDAKFILNEKIDVLWVDPKFVKSDSSGKYLKIGKPNNKIRIETGVEGDNKVEIKGDINEGDVIYD